MDFEHALRTIVRDLDSRQVRYALIGGMAMAFRGIQRTTLDLDFIILLDDLQVADSALRNLGYSRCFHSENVSQYASSHPALGRIDILHAFRGPTLGMLDRAERIHWHPDAPLVPVVHTEDLIGLKVQALVNDPSRQIRDWADIQLMIQTAAQRSQPIDWDLVGDYLELFHLSHQLHQLQALYGETH